MENSKWNEKQEVGNDLLKNDHHEDTTNWYQNLGEDEKKYFHYNDDNSF